MDVPWAPRIRRSLHLSIMFIERFERVALESYTGSPPSLWFRYMDDTLEENKIEESELVPFFARTYQQRGQ